jgi:hypothetical protein
VASDHKLPEEIAPTGPKLSRFRILPAPPIRPHLFPDEARFAFRLALLAFGAELAFWLMIGDRSRTLLFVVFCRLLKPLWAALGRRVSRTLIAAGLIALPLITALGVVALSLLSRAGHPTPHALAPLLFVGVASLGLPAVFDLCAATIGDSVTVERRPAAYSWLEMGQSIGAAVGIAAAFSNDRVVVGALLVGMLLAAVGVPQLKDRGTPCSAWPASGYVAALRSPVGAQLSVLAFLCTALAWTTAQSVLPEGYREQLPQLSRQLPSWLGALMPLLGMAVAARLEPRMPNAVWLPRLATMLAAAGWFASLQPVSLFGLGVMLASLPAAVARGAGEMERPIVSSVTWSALTAGAALGAVLHF